uniref:Brambleberry n=1 Tax=Neogobius melanostomus TaxID=47308 RepID=A0A8C6TFA9_9GOBI
MAHLVNPHFLFVLLLCQCPAVSGLFEWMRKTELPPASQPPASSAESVTPAFLAKEAQFEMTIADEKFLAEAKLIEMSPLDSCHQRVVALLKSSCESLSEQQLAKLGVVLFNCQAEIEGRRTYPCTEKMTLRECTATMDPDTWNAYHIVSNRARSVCYATRQMLFRRRAEHTVNALISTATSQLDAMKDLKEGQLELRQMTAASLDKVLQGHSALQAQQSKLHEEQEQMETSLMDNLERLGQEKALIASGQELVAQLIQGIRQRMENVSEHLQIQSSEVQDSHHAIVKDLTDVRHQAQDIYHKIDTSMIEFLQYQHQTSLYYSDLMTKLERMNSTLSFVLHYLDNMQSRFDERLYVIQKYLGWAGLSLTAMWTCMLHAGYFVLGAILLTFLGCPGFSRAMLLFTVPLNAVAEVNQQPALDLCSLSLLLLTLSLGYWFIGQLWTRLHINNEVTAPLPLEQWEIIEPEKPQSSPSCPQSSTPERSFGDLFEAANDSQDFVNDSRSASPNPSIMTNSSLSSRLLCNGTTKAGKACKKRAVPGQEYCRVHEGGHTSYVNLL